MKILLLSRCTYMRNMIINWKFGTNNKLREKEKFVHIRKKRDGDQLD